MFQDNPLLAQLKQQIQENLPKKEGTVKATDKAFGFLEVDSKTSIFIAPPFMKKVMHGDKVSAIIREENDKKQAEPETLIESSLTRFIGRVKLQKGKLAVTPDHPQMKKLNIKAKTRVGLKSDDLQEGDWVVAHLSRHPLTDDKAFFCEISKLVAKHDDKIAPWWVTLAQNDLPNAEPQGIENWQLNDEDGIERVDLTQMPFVTIDGASTKDMDDALHARVLESGDIELTIAIADPTAYIKQDDEMDQVAAERAFTIYLPGRNVPMLPRDLADDLCSLKPNELRPAICCTVTVKTDGSLGDDAKFFAANIQSRAQLVYDHVSDYLENGSSPQWQAQGEIKQVVDALAKMATLRASWRQNNAVIFPDRPDYRFELSEDNDVIAIHAEMRRSANRLVEEAMVSANICAGKLLREEFGFGVFNSHPGLKEDKIKGAVELVNTELSQEFSDEQVATVAGFAELRRVLAKQESSYLDNRIRKMQSFGKIGNEPLPHFAMGLETYATWTSPIRKYGDMVNHRLIKAFISGHKEMAKPCESITENLNAQLKFNRMAERTIGDWLYARTLAPEVEAETEFTAEVFDINRAGVRARLIENGASVFIPCSLILDNKERLLAERELGVVNVDGETLYRLGDLIKVKLHEINHDNRAIVAKPSEVFSS
ncbi:exoribonuclease II [Paraferrimonas sp. SM1919]|uniref:exoribonuclease II n=1 Tax=Paraferrimonas sp. SM1919 TaxID=2662263 RepID=UPI0013D65CEA|nr:exoribonuclease II [Paraferrimonas sp. SM1919]